MMASPPRKKDWVLTQAAFDQLLQRLDPGGELAGLKYESLRLSLTEFFRSRSCHGCADLADETIDRGTRRISEGVEIQTNDPVSYFIGIAVRVVHEHQRKQNSSVLSPAPIDHEELENKLECREKCFQTLDLETRAFLREYCAGDYAASIKHHRKMAQRLGISVNALRLRVYHHRESLADCIKKCLEEKERH